MKFIIIFVIFICLFSDSVLYTIGRAIIWHEAHTTHNMFIVYNSNFIRDNFALATVSVSVSPHNNTHIQARLIVHKAFALKVVQKHQLFDPSSETVIVRIAFDLSRDI